MRGAQRCCLLLRVLPSLLQERVVTFVLRQEEGSETISKAALLQFLQHEYEVGVCSGHAAFGAARSSAVHHKWHARQHTQPVSFPARQPGFAVLATGNAHPN